MKLIDADALRVQMYRESFETDTYIQRWDSGRWISYKMFENVLDNAPTIEPQRWIPVTERLPEHSGFYIVTAIVTDDGGKLVGLRWFSQEHGWKFGKNPLAWMPLPESYKESEVKK